MLEEKRRAENEKKARAEKIKQDRINARIAREKEQAVRLERQAKMRAAAEASRLEQARGAYESNIYSELFAAWSLPYSRSNVRCSVELTIGRDGSIISHRFLDRCNDFYTYSIEEAIRTVGSFKRVEDGVFRGKEIVNFIDSVTSSSIG